jgi:hypothetical protein
MSEVSLMVSDTSITVAFDGKLETIKSGDHRFETVLRAIRKGDTNSLPELLDPNQMFKHIPNVELVDGRIQIKGKTIPDSMTNRVLRFKEKGLPFDPLLRFSEKLLDNPSFNSRNMLYDFLEHNGHPLTMDGNFIAYKAVRKDFKDIHSGTMSNAVGNYVSMPRSDVDDNPNNTCSSGLHVATYDYAKDFGDIDNPNGGGGIMLEIEINPRDVVAVPNDYNGTKMRVCAYTVRKVSERFLEDIELIEEAKEITYGDLVRMKKDRGGFNVLGQVEAIANNTIMVDGEVYAKNDVELV